MTTLMALGRDQVAFLLCMALVGAVARQAFRSDGSIAYLASRAGVIATAFGLTLVLMIVPIMLTMQFLHGSNRPGIAFGRALEGSLDPINLVTLFAPNVFGSLAKVYDYWGPGVGAVTGTDWTDRSIDYLFAGTLPAVLLVWHGMAGGRLFERGARYFALVLAAAIIYALGRYTSIFGFVFDWLPGVSMYRRPADASFLVNVSLAFCAGYLLHRFIEEGLPRLQAPRPVAWGVVATVVAMIAALVGATLVFARAEDRSDDAMWQLAGAAAAALVVVAALVVFRRRARRPLAAAVLVAATAAQLLWVNTASPLNAEPTSTYSAFDAAPWPDQAHGLAVLQAELARRHAEGARPACRVPRPLRRLAERRHGLQVRGHARLQPAAHRRLRPRRRRRRGFLLLRPARLSRHVPRLQLASRRSLGARVSRAERADRRHAAHVPAPARHPALRRDRVLPVPARRDSRAARQRRHACRAGRRREGARYRQPPLIRARSRSSDRDGRRGRGWQTTRCWRRRMAPCRSSGSRRRRATRPRARRPAARPASPPTPTMP